jgi:glycosyltransferase involved in cell wall biosynthesis
MSTLRQQQVSVTFISSYIPRKCGIATFTKDVTKAINDLNPRSHITIVALQNADALTYPQEVVQVIEKDAANQYTEAAVALNTSDADIVCLQHEYGLFGGSAGEYILKLLGRVRQPIITTLHTVLSNPTPQEEDILLRVAKLSEAVVVMTADAKSELENRYQISPHKIVIIQHGVADRPQSIQAAKPSLGWDNRPVLLMTGLLSRGKGAEYVIKALPAIVAAFPDILFVLVGQTHPEVLKFEGESYRDELTNLAESLGVTQNLTMVNEYLSLDELLRHYDGCDIYLTPHLDKQQSASGTLAYALGMGKACISTPYTYARETLSNGRGKLVDFKDESAIAAAVLEILNNPEQRTTMERAAYAVGRNMSWPLVAERYLMLFRIIQEKANRPHQ